MLPSKIHLLQRVSTILRLTVTKNIQHGFSIEKTNVEPGGIINDLEDTKLKEELRSCQHFLAVSEFGLPRPKVFSYAVEKLNETVVNEKLDQFFNKLKCAPKVIMLFVCFLKNIEDGIFRYFYPNENDTLLDRSKHVCTRDDMTKLKDLLTKLTSSTPVAEEEFSQSFRG